MHVSLRIHRKAVMFSLTPKNTKEFLLCRERKQYRKNKPRMILQNAAWHLLPSDVPFKHIYSLIPPICVSQSESCKE